MTKIKQPKIDLDIPPNGKLIRLNDNLIREGRIQFIEHTKEGRGKSLHNKPKVGYSTIVDFQNYPMCTWQTSEIVEVMSDTEFKTKNSHYKIELL